MKNKVFVYGTLKKGYSNHDYFLKGNSTFIKEYVTEPEYTMLDVVSFPYLIKTGNTAIHGEIYEVDDKTLDRLDYLEGYQEDNETSSHYLRRTIDVPDIGEVFIYLQNTNKTFEELNKDQINTSGIWHNERHKVV